jgi:uncharacterized protein YqjF (DUF2071 family)
MSPSLLSMRWRDLMFAHYPVAPDRLRARLPDRVSVDTYDGQGWLGVVSLTMADVRPLFAPFGLTFPQVNLRTYVTVDGDPGVYFFSMDADERLAVTASRKSAGIPHYLAEASVRRDDTDVRFESERVQAGEPDAEFRATYGPAGELEHVEPGSFEAFAIDRYRFYLPGRKALYTGVVDHDPWRLRSAAATVEENTLFAAADLGRPAAKPRLHVAPPVDVTAGELGRRSIDGTPINEPIRF